MKNRFYSVMTLLLVAGLLVSGVTQAKGNKGDRDGFGGPPSATAKLARMSQHLGLTAEQEAAMLLVLQENEEQRALLHQQAMEMLGPEICAQRLRAEQQVLSILNAEQAELFLQHLQERTKKRGERRGGPVDCSQYEDADG